MSKNREEFIENYCQLETALSQVYGLAIMLENGALHGEDIFKARKEEEDGISSPLYSMAGIIKEKVEFCLNRIGSFKVPN